MMNRLGAAAALNVPLQAAQPRGVAAPAEHAIDRIRARHRLAIRSAVAETTCVQHGMCICHPGVVANAFLSSRSRVVVGMAVWYR